MRNAYRVFFDPVVFMPGETSYVVRPHRASDMEWVVAAHREIPSSEFGFNQDFVQMVKRVVGDFLQNFDGTREHCWIAEMTNEPVGCIFLMSRSIEVAQIHLFLVSPKARGLGIGRRLVDECVKFARDAGYHRIVLETDSVSVAARHLYQKAGFVRVHAEPHHFFGRDTVGESWELRLTG